MNLEVSVLQTFQSMDVGGFIKKNEKDSLNFVYRENYILILAQQLLDPMWMGSVTIPRQGMRASEAAGCAATSQYDDDYSPQDMMPQAQSLSEISFEMDDQSDA